MRELREPCDLHRRSTTIRTLPRSEISEISSRMYYRKILFFSLRAAPNETRTSSWIRCQMKVVVNEKVVECGACNVIGGDLRYFSSSKHTRLRQTIARKGAAKPCRPPPQQPPPVSSLLAHSSGHLNAIGLHLGEARLRPSGCKQFYALKFLRGIS